MSAYSVTIASTPDGSAVVNEEVFNSSRFVSEADAPEAGLTVEDNQGRSRVVSASSDLNEDDRLVIDGIPVTVAQARALGYTGLLNRKVAESSREIEQFTDTGQLAAEDDGSDPEPDRLAKAVEDGLTTYEEVNAGETIAATLQLHTGLNSDDSAELIRDIVSGEVPEHDEVWSALRAKGIGKEGFQASVSQATKLSTNAAMRELGPDRFADLDRMSAESASIRNLVIKHGIARATGRTAVSWADVYSLAKSYRSR